MQGEGAIVLTKSGKPVTVVRKPTLIGSWHGRDAIRQGFRVMVSILFVSFLYVALSLLLSFDVLVLRVLTGMVLVSIAMFYLYTQGVAVGQNDAAFGEIMYLRQAEGKAISTADMQRCFHPFKGLCSALIGALPYVLLALPFALTTTAETYTLGVLPSWMAPYTHQSGIGDALAFYAQRSGIGLMTVMRIAVRSMTMPFIQVALAMGRDAVLLAERLTPLWVLVAPVGYALGYAQGINVRARVNTGIAIGDQRKKHKARKEQRARQAQAQSRDGNRLI